MMILFRKIFDVSKKTKVDLKKKRSEMGFSKIDDVKERVVSILKFVKENTKDFERDLSWAIGKLLDGTLSEKEENLEKQELKELRNVRRGAILQMEENAWVKTCSNVFKLK